MLNFFDFIQVYVFSTNHHLNGIASSHFVKEQEISSKYRALPDSAQSKGPIRSIATRSNG